MDFALQVAQRVFDSLNEAVAARREAAHGDDGVTLRVIVSDDEHFPERLHAMRDALDDLVGRLAGFGEKNFHLRSRTRFLPHAAMPSAIEHDGDWGAGRITVEAQHVHKFIARGHGVARLARREFRPAMQEAVTVHEYAYERHDGR